MYTSVFFLAHCHQYTQDIIKCIEVKERECKRRKFIIFNCFACAVMNPTQTINKLGLGMKGSYNKRTIPF